MGKKRKSLDFDDFELDPILPLPAGTGLPPIKQGDGKRILNDTSLKVVELPYRAFFQAWEHAEAVAANQYARYVGGPLDHAASASLEAVKAFREAALGQQFPNLSEDEAQKMRARLAKQAKKKADAEAAKMAKARAAKRDGAESPVDNEGTPVECPKCGPNRTILAKKSKKTGALIWRCADCRHAWPRSVPGEAPERPVEALERSKRTTNGGKKKKVAQKPTQKAKKSKK